MARFVVCVPAPSGSPSVAPCGDADGVSYVPSMVELAAPGEVSFQNAQTLFAYGFEHLLIFFFVSFGIGAVLAAIRGRFG